MARTKITAQRTPESSKGASAPQSRSQSVSQTSSKKVRIVEPSEQEIGSPVVKKQRTGPPKSILSKKDKGKAPLVSSSQPESVAPVHSDSETESISPTKLASSSKQAKQKKIPKGKGAKSQIPQPPPTFNTKSVMINTPTTYENKYKTRDLCPAIYVDLDDVNRMLGLDVKEYLIHYEKLIGLRNSYSPDMVRIFYNNMIEKNTIGKKGKVHEYALQTMMRGDPIYITADLLNMFLGTNEFDQELKVFSNAEVQSLLRPGEELGDELRFEPSSMPVLQRTIHYVYSRCLINKGKNYTHLSSSDYQFLASIMSKEKRNIGQMVFNEMRKLVTSKSKKMTLPYPCLVSRIMEIHEIWYLMPDQMPLTPIKFAESHFHRMNIDIIVPQPVAAPSRKRKATSASSRGQDEAQSSAPQQAYSAPSFAHAAIQTFMETEFKKLGEAFITDFHSTAQGYVSALLHKAMEYFSGKELMESMGTLKTSVTSLEHQMSEGFTTLMSSVSALDSRVASLDSRVSSIEDFVRGTPHTPAPAPPVGSEPSSSEGLLGQIDFSASAQPLDSVPVPPPETTAPPPESTDPPPEPETSAPPSSETPDIPTSSPPHPL